MQYEAQEIDDDVVITLENIGKCFHVYENAGDRLKQLIFSNKKSYYREFWALKDISFKIRKGEVVGIVGRNGSGKSTILQIIAGTLDATEGVIRKSGRLAALLELGSGFDPEFTGRENIFLNAALLGLSETQIKERLEDIISFADIGDFIDQPIKNYSSGMVVRLAFAVQSQIDPEILIVDEALAVGDAKFQAKCFERLNQLKSNGTSILFVSHSTDQVVTHCSRAILIDNGKLLGDGDPNLICNQYLELLFLGEAKKTEFVKQSENTKSSENKIQDWQFDDDVFHTHMGYNPQEYRWGVGGAKITDFSFSVDGKNNIVAVHSNQLVTLEVALKFLEPVQCPIFGITIKTKEGVAVFGTNTKLAKIKEFSGMGGEGARVIIRADFKCNFGPGDYFISLGIVNEVNNEVVPLDRRYDSIHFQVHTNGRFFGLVNSQLTFDIQDLH